MADGRLLVLSPFGEKERRVTAELARRRNEFVAALADRIFIAYAAPGGHTERFARTIVAWGKPVLTLDSPDNQNLVAIGAQAIAPPKDPR
jgi:predicted Rossmann fold nucleotide-binding protein DprA/Smf involved in DNA uptake